MEYLTDYLAKHAKELADKPAIITQETTLSWKNLADRVDAAAEIVLQYTKPESSAVVSMLLPNSWEFVVAYWAIVRTGNMAAPQDVSFPTREIHAINKQITPTLIITRRDLRGQLGNVGVPVIYVEDFPIRTDSLLPP